MTRLIWADFAQMAAKHDPSLVAILVSFAIFYILLVIRAFYTGLERSANKCACEFSVDIWTRLTVQIRSDCNARPGSMHGYNVNRPYHDSSIPSNLHFLYHLSKESERKPIDGQSMGGRESDFLKIRAGVSILLNQVHSRTGPYDCLLKFRRTLIRSPNASKPKLVS